MKKNDLKLDFMKPLTDLLTAFWDKISSELKDNVTPVATTEVKMDGNKKKITVELPEPPSPGGYSYCPSGDSAYDEASVKWRKSINAKILEAVPQGYYLKSSEVKKQEIVRYYADIIVECLVIVGDDVGDKHG